MKDFSPGTHLDALHRALPALLQNKDNGSMIRIAGGYLLNALHPKALHGRFVAYLPDDHSKQSIVFDGVTCDRKSLLGYAYQLSGIHVGSEPEQSFHIGLLIHEYGHFLQQEHLGCLCYVLYAGTGSLLAQLRTRCGSDYYAVFSERTASLYGQSYIDRHYPQSGYRATGMPAHS